MIDKLWIKHDKIEKKLRKIINSYPEFSILPEFDEDFLKLRKEFGKVINQIHEYYENNKK